jgi:hypothetical protein
VEIRSKNGVVIDAADDHGYEFVIAVADGSIDDIAEIAAVLGSHVASLSR